jgi:hypothetical protein
MHLYSIQEAIRDGLRVRVVPPDGECVVERTCWACVVDQRQR